MHRLRSCFFVREVPKAQVILCVLPSILGRYGRKKARKVFVMSFSEQPQNEKDTLHNTGCPFHKSEGVKIHRQENVAAHFPGAIL